jgi:lysophospholipid acyltransferase (LPLAT)-like uncharacterized protein
MNHRILLFLLRSFLWSIILLLCKSLRIRSINAEKFEELRRSNKRYVVAFWHGSMLVGWFLHRPKAEEKISALISQSKDGEYLSAVLERWGYLMIRGSSHVGGKEAMQLMVEAIDQGSSLAITPDGSKGPRQIMKMGAVRAAQKTQVPLVLCGIAVEQKRQLRSWDKFEVPNLFAKTVVMYSDPIYVPKELSGDMLNAFLEVQQSRLDHLTISAENCL